jgi:peptidoglycan/LPS O-acetylase OafA/YrhL
MHETKSRFAGLQLARGIAAMLVTLYHTSNHLRLDFGYLPMQGIFISDVQASIFSLF